MENKAVFPLWFNIVTVFVILSNLLVFGLFSLLHPDLPWPDVALTAAAPIQFFAARHIAFAVPLAHGFITKNVTVLRAMYTLFFVLALLDFGLLAFGGHYIPVLYKFTGELSLGSNLLISLSLFIVPMGLSLRYLRARS